MVTVTTEEYDAIMARMNDQAAALGRVVEVVKDLDLQSAGLDKCQEVRKGVVARLKNALAPRQ